MLASAACTDDMLASRLLRARPLAVASAAAATALATSRSNSTENASWFSSRPDVTLNYFAVQGAAETIRYVMVIGDCTWNETGWPVDFKKFAGPDSLYKPDGPCPGFAEANANGVLDKNCGRAPVVVIDGKESIGQSKTIERYLARRLGVMGASEFEAAQIDGITEHIRDLKDKYNKAKNVEKDKKEASVKDYFTKEMPAFFAKIEKSLPPATGAPLVGKRLSYADVTLYCFVVDFFTDKAPPLAALDACPRLKASIDAVGSHPGVVKYRAARTNVST